MPSYSPVLCSFYPRSPCGERLNIMLYNTSSLIFLSTLSLRRATDVIAVMTEAQSLSIHALLAESDRLWIMLYSCPGTFYPRSPCGERRISNIINNVIKAFYPRSPCGERRWLRCWQLAARDLSIHALLAESDLYGCYSLRHSAYFLSTLSLRRATTNYAKVTNNRTLSIHALLAESDT